jgi:hypothetical protein
MAHLRFRQLRVPPLLGVHVSNDSLCALIDMDMLHPDVLIAPMT